MGFLLGRAEKRSNDTGWFATGGDSPTTVSEDRATHLAPVFATFRHLVDYISTLPADFYRVEGEKRTQVAAPELIRNVDMEYGLTTWLGQAVYGVCARGNAVGEITSLSGWNLPTMIRWAGDWSGGDGNVDWYLDGKPKPDRLVAHIPWIVPPGKRLGLSPIAHYAAIVAAGLSAQEYADIKRGGGIPPTVLKNSARTLIASEAQQMQSRASASFASGKPFITGNDWDLSMPTIPPSHAQFIETLKLSANQIAAIYGIDPREIGGSTDNSLTYTTDESRALNRSQNARPYVTRVETAIDRMLPQGIVMKLNMNATIRADIKTQTEVVGAKLADGRLSLDEARALDDRGPIPGGNRYNVPVPSTVPAQREGATP
jgi:flagellum-specific peptidoglycan hydrolase FlgJ